MKKSIKILIIVGIILLVAIIGVICIIASTINKEKTPISSTQFKIDMEDKGFYVADVTSQFKEYGNYMTTGYVAGKDGYQIEFYILSNLDNAIDMYNSNKLKFESSKDNASASYTVNMKNYSICSITSNGKYKYVSRIDNTLIYVDVDDEHQNDVKNIIKELGY